MKVTLYNSEGCHLCHEAEEMLRRIRRNVDFDLQITDIRIDDEVHKRYWDRIPVILRDGKEIASAPIDEKALRRALTARR